MNLVCLLGGYDGVDEAREGDVTQLRGAHVEGGQLHLSRGEGEDIRQPGEREVSNEQTLTSHNHTQSSGK